MGEILGRVRACIWRDEDKRLELFLFRLLCLAATLLSFLVIIPVNYLLNLPPLVNHAVAIFGLGALLLSRETCRDRYHLKTLFFLYLALLNVCWFDNAGSLGSVGYYFLCGFLYVPIFFRGATRSFLFGLVIADVILLHVAEYAFPHLVIGYSSHLAGVADIFTGLLISALSSSLMLWVLLKRHEQEQQRLVAMNEELRESAFLRACVEKTLLQERQLLNSLIEGTTDAIYVKDLNGRYLLFNSGAVTLTGRSAQEALGRDDTAIFPAAAAAEIMEIDKRVLAAGKAMTADFMHMDTNGDVRFFESTKGPLQDGQGNVVGLFGISRDVTGPRRMAEELRRLNEELEKRVVERTARLEAAVREQESFSYSVSHDLRGPLRHINSYTAILDEDFGSFLPKEARQCLGRIRTSTRRMGDLIDDLLELSRIGRSELVKVPVSLSELAQQIGDKLQEGEPARQVELVIQPGLQVNGDRVLLEQMLENLIGNAWKYSSPRDRARIELGRGVVGEREAFFVRDNGVGFDMAYKDKLFGPFQRLHGSEFEGTGIGLATVKRIVERHDGEVWAHGEVDQGATVYFVLPT